MIHTSKCVLPRDLYTGNKFCHKKKKFLYNYDFVTDYVISGNDKTWPNSVSQVLFGLEKWFTHQNVSNQDILPTETIWSLINNDVSCDYIIFNYLFF